jgi:hypothetical protein
VCYNGSRAFIGWQSIMVFSTPSFQRIRVVRAPRCRPGTRLEDGLSTSRALADRQNRFTVIERKLVEHDGRFTLLPWMLGLNLVMTVACFFQVFG